MKKIIFSCLILLGLGFQVKAQDSEIFPKGPKAANVHHIGDIYLSSLVQPDSTFEFGVGYVVSEAGSHLYWHEHPAGQILFILDGEGLYQERGQALQTVKKGDIIKCQPGIQHWHGATPNSRVIYMAASPAGKGATIWHEALKPGEYPSK
ncbi:quercetin dioxygenase-like cupin family protein [Algoriphagus boseongensis]|uniref:Quercetin dioxygenase-like cupin family protein n=1 Tax=Algoriphagus boseongensis TaxID=1442587 RepID=A0A4R6TB44_9BACT|nr:cupin domain-containing protein [Algoriphagus boseongensis]TDQ19453.1 quercetin dioxygenase-like cupin family protein [Algoriphagus boseongensis]